MDLLQLRYFRVVARHEHMTKAAQELFIAQPSLSQTIGRLEKEMGVPLFDRHGRLNTSKRCFVNWRRGSAKSRIWPGWNTGRFRLVQRRCTGSQKCYVVSRPSILRFAFTSLSAHRLGCPTCSKQESVISASCPHPAFSLTSNGN